MVSLSAMVLSWLRDIRDHKWLAVRAIVVGWTALWLLWIVLAFRLLRFAEWLFVGGVVDIRAFWPRGATEAIVPANGMS